MGLIRLLLLADTHLGFDMPFRPRVERRRRGPDFFARFREALAPARAGAVDLVVHGGDLLYRSRVPPALVQMAMEPLFEVADGGVPVFLVPGNHERSRIPYPLLTVHPNVHIFDRPRTYRCEFGGATVSLAGFPFARRVGARFAALVEATGFTEVSADIRLLSMHQAVEGARVGVHDFTFRPGSEVIAGRQIPGEFAAVLSGHIHRRQALTRDLLGTPLGAPVIYPGSTERTSFVERDEAKGYALVDVDRGAGPPGRLVGASFAPLSTRPMRLFDLDGRRKPGRDLERELVDLFQAMATDAVVCVRIAGPLEPGADRVISAANVRRMAPPTMNVTVRLRGP
jgi:DNA repair exonuclease SbcCD nuclease subunit